LELGRLEGGGSDLDFRSEPSGGMYGLRPLRLCPALSELGNGERYWPLPATQPSSVIVSFAPLQSLSAPRGGNDKQTAEAGAEGGRMTTAPNFTLTSLWEILD
jgi:hypothetical protein